MFVKQVSYLCFMLCVSLLLILLIYVVDFWKSSVLISTELHSIWTFLVFVPQILVW